MKYHSRHHSGGEIWEVRMRGVWSDKASLSVEVISESPYRGQYVNCSRSQRQLGAEYVGLVYSILRDTSLNRHCILVNEQGVRDPEALTRIL